MTTQKLFKRRVRERMSKTGESYTAARRHVAPGRDRLEAARRRLASAKELASDEKISEATGQDWEAWLSLLDRWGARDRKHGETVDFLVTRHGVPGWWAQAITTGYERARGMRLKHQQPNGFTIYASKTVGVPIGVLFDAFADERTRAQWLTDGSMFLRTSQPGRVARFDWADGPTRVLVTFEVKGPSKATAYVSHERLPDPGAAEAAKHSWKARLAALKSFLESTDV
ncbi:MAG: DUF4287 domain-containing protein [Candidatus Limnocylindria bacterium]